MQDGIIPPTRSTDVNSALHVPYVPLACRLQVQYLDVTLRLRSAVSRPVRARNMPRKPGSNWRSMRLPGVSKAYEPWNPACFCFYNSPFIIRSGNHAVSLDRDVLLVRIS